MSSLRARILHALMTPKQVMVMNANGAAKVRHFNIRPASILFILFVFTAIGAGIGYGIFTQLLPQHTSYSSQHRQSSHAAQQRLAETEAKLQLASQQVDALKKNLNAQQKDSETIRQRVNLYESILEARKAKDPQILKARITWHDTHTLKYNIVLVKGGNYPRLVTGWIRMIAEDDAGHKQVLKLGKAAPELPYSMGTHTFLHGTAQWTVEDWRPDHVMVIRLNKKGVVRDQMNITIEK